MPSERVARHVTPQTMTFSNMPFGGSTWQQTAAPPGGAPLPTLHSLTKNKCVLCTNLKIHVDLFFLNKTFLIFMVALFFHLKHIK